MKTTLIILACIIGIAATVLFVLAEFFYEVILNMKVVRKYAKRFNLYDDTIINLFRNNQLYSDSMKWFVKLKLHDTVIKNNKGKDVHGYIIENEDKTDKWAICVHGYMGAPSIQAPYAKHFYDSGYSVICPSLRAHGEDKNRYCSMGWHDKDIVIAWINYLVNKYPDCEIVLHGISMGAATVMLATGENLPANVKCAISDCGFSSCKKQFIHVMKSNMKIPVFPFFQLGNMISVVRGNFNFLKCEPVKAVAKSNTPTLFIHGTADIFVPYSVIDDVWEACSAEKERLDVADAPHAVSLAYDPQLYFSAMNNFIKKYTT